MSLAFDWAGENLLHSEERSELLSREKYFWSSIWGLSPLDSLWILAFCSCFSSSPLSGIFSYMKVINKTKCLTIFSSLIKPLFWYILQLLQLKSFQGLFQSSWPPVLKQEKSIDHCVGISNESPSMCFQTEPLFDLLGFENITHLFHTDE